MKRIIYWFSGTGNSRAIARDVAARHGDIDLVPIVTALQVGTEPAATIGVVFPVYCFGIPRIVRRFLKTVDLSEASYVFSIATSGGMPGLAHHEVQSILRDRGFALHAGWSVTMPSNYTPFGGAPNPEKLERILERAAAKVETMANGIAREEKRVLEDAPLIIRLPGAVVRRVMFPRLLREDRKFLVQSHCTSCGTCESVCPVHNVQIKDGIPTWHGNCEQCFACLQWCPVEAIQFGRHTEGRARYTHPDFVAGDFAINRWNDDE